MVRGYPGSGKIGSCNRALLSTRGDGRKEKGYALRIARRAVVVTVGGRRLVGRWLVALGGGRMVELHHDTGLISRRVRSSQVEALRGRLAWRSTVGTLVHCRGARTGLTSSLSCRDATLSACVLKTQVWGLRGAPAVQFEGIKKVALPP